ncbi:MAG TPA: hypothetical protein VFC78_24305 [Tepidisphaeraceae bacterium]|nr:hypothetical protein [Tepidisphaeraceae bacterium]
MALKEVADGLGRESNGAGQLHGVKIATPNRSANRALAQLQRFGHFRERE